MVKVFLLWLFVYVGMNVSVWLVTKCLLDAGGIFDIWWCEVVSLFIFTLVSFSHTLFLSLSQFFFSFIFCSFHVKVSYYEDKSVSWEKAEVVEWLSHKEMTSWWWQWWCWWWQWWLSLFLFLSLSFYSSPSSILNSLTWAKEKCCNFAHKWALSFFTWNILWHFVPCIFFLSFLLFSLPW